MAKCPNCNNEIVEDFGLVTCASCGAQVMLEMDGVSAPLEISSQNIAQAEAEASPAIQAIEQEQAEEYQVEEIEVKATVENEFLEPLEPSPTAPPMATKREPANPDMREIANYGNSIVSQGNEGMLRYNLFISGIDTAEMRSQLHDTISDAKFLWDADELISHIESGELKIQDLTAIKASILVQRIRNLSLDIRWEQYAIHQA